MRATARVYGILAKEANTVVLLRRGPSRSTLMLTWDLKTDKITPGQWLKGRVRELNCDVSPDGKYLVALCSNYSEAHRKRHPDQEIPWTWTAICRPPYFTALTLWTGPRHELDGGVWMSNTHLGLASWHKSSDAHKPVPSWLKIRRGVSLECGESPLFEQIMANKGWNVLSTYFDKPESIITAVWNLLKRKGPRIGCDGVMTREFDGGSICRLAQAGGSQWQLLNTKGLVIRTWATQDHPGFWIELDDNRFPIFAENGCLYRWTSFPDGEPILVADLNHHTFTEVPPPHLATQW